MLAVFIIINGAYDQKTKCAVYISVIVFLVLCCKMFLHVGDISCSWLAGS